ncbi:MAG: cytochrome c [Gammaproteobacteria bacterium]|nr:cytochrome c [Gammaproteobacteria bacterium]MDH5304470.1 cytochrome c [Gammaproteobacteria bacterium]
MPRKSIGAILVVAISTTLSIYAFAETTAEDAAQYRTNVMTSLRGHTGAASMIVRGQVEDGGHLVAHARGLASGASELARLFPAGSNVGESEALPAIWEKPAEFAAAIDKLTNATSVFLAAAESGDKEAIAAAFRDVGGSCRGCHDQFRVAQE